MKNTKIASLSAPVKGAINQVVGDVASGKSVIFCGAGISKDSGLPLVSELVPHVLWTLCQSPDEMNDLTPNAIDKNHDKIGVQIKTAADRMGVTPDVVNEIVYSLPFEAFIETLRSRSNADEILSIYDVDAYKPRPAPNKTHHLLAGLLAVGKVKTIVTANFDRLIETALEQQGKKAGIDYDVIYREDDLGKIDWGHDRARLIKIHGSIDDRQAMAITLSQIAMKAHSAARASVMRQVFSRGNHESVLIIGYSCSDAFDITPQIQALGQNLKRVYLVQHCDEPKVEGIREQDAKNPFKGIASGIRLFLDTGELVEALWKAALKRTYRGQSSIASVPNWKAKVEVWHELSVLRSSGTSSPHIRGLILNAISEYRPALEQYEVALSIASRSKDDEQELRVLTDMAAAYSSLGAYDKALKLNERALEIAGHVGDVRDECVLLNNMGIVAERLGNYDKAIELHQKALDIYRQTGNLKGEGNSLKNIGVVHSSLGQYRRSIEFHQLSLAIAQTVGDVARESDAISNLGVAWKNLGDYKRAIEFHERALHLYRAIADIQAESATLGNLANAYKNIGDFKMAINLNHRALVIARRIGDVRGEGTGLMNLANIFRNLEKYRGAIRLYDRSLRIARRIGEQRLAGAALSGMANAHSGLCDYGKAIELYGQAVQIARHISDKRGEGTYLSNIGVAHANIGEREMALEAFAQSKAVFTELGLANMVGRVDEIMKEVGY